jgi:choline dehydrogenase
METFDYVIIGAGSAGSVLASRLGEDLGTKICVLEAGPSDWHPYIHLPAGFIKTFHMKSINWAYQQEVGPWTGGRSIYAPRGKTLGGSSSINGHIYNRGQRQDFDTWAQMGNRGWGYPDVLPYFKRLERRVGEGDDTYRGREGTAYRHHHGLEGSALRGLHGRRRSVSAFPRIPTTTARSRKACPIASAPSRAACA